jgi:hypothetical protein
MALPTNGEKITAAFVQQYHQSYEIEAQQKESRLQMSVRDLGGVTGSSFTINDMGAVEMQPSGERYGDTAWTIPDSGTRVAYMADYDLFLPIDPRDLPKLVANPSDPYQQQLLSSEKRKRDDIIYTALGADIMRKTSEGGALTATALPAGQKIAADGTGLTLAKIIAAKSLFRKNECDEHNGETLWMIYDSNALRQLMSDPNLTTADRMAGKALQQGSMAGEWMGFKWIPYEKLASPAASTRTTFAYCGSAIHFGRVPVSDFGIDIRPDKKRVRQVGGIVSYGAGRANEKKVVQIDFMTNV